jgi:hypothetical protein
MFTLMCAAAKLYDTEFTGVETESDPGGGCRGGKPWLDPEIWGSKPRRLDVVLPYRSSTPQITQNAHTRTICVCYVVNRLE